MSEVRETSTIENISIPEPEPVLSFAELLAGIGPLTREAEPLTRSLKATPIMAAPRPTIIASSFGQIAGIVKNASSVKDAASSIIQRVPLNVTVREGNQWRRLLQRAVATNDKSALARTVASIALSQQERLRRSVIAITQRVLARNGFTEQQPSGADGLVIAKRPNSSQMFSVEVACSKQGGMDIHFDLDGFHGGSCIDALNQVQADLAQEGILTNTRHRQRKDPRAAYDGKRVEANISNDQ